MFVKWLDVKICSGKTFCYPSLAFSLLLIFFQNYQRSGHFPLSKSIISSTSPPLIFFQNYQLKNAEPRPFSLLENRHFSSSRPHLPPSFPPVPPSPARPPSASDFPNFFKGSGTLLYSKYYYYKGAIRGSKGPILRALRGDIGSDAISVHFTLLKATNGPF